MNILNFRRNTALVPVAFSISLLVYFLAYTAKVPIRVTVTAPYLEIKVEIHLDESQPRPKLLQNVTDMLITFDDEKTTITSSKLN